MQGVVIPFRRVVIPEVGDATPAGIVAVWDVVLGAVDVAASMLGAGDRGWREVYNSMVWPHFLRVLELERQLDVRTDARRAMGL